MGAPTSDAGLASLYKVWYTDKELQNLLFRDSPALKKFGQGAKRIGGKTYNYAMLYGRGGAVAGDATVAAAVAATTAKVAEAAAGIGKIFSIFNITNLEKMASEDAKGAYAPAAIAKMFAATEGARKTLASAMYGSGFGEITNLNGAVIAGAATMTVDAVIGFEVGTRFVVTTTGSATALPSSALVGGGTGTVFTVTGIDDAALTVTFDPVAPGGGFVDDAWVNLAGSRDGSGAGLLPEGFGALLPSYFDRTGANWTGYIGTSFRGITRSAQVSRLAGNFVKKGVAEKKADVIIRAINLARMHGGEPDMIVMNNFDYLDVTIELQTNTTYWQGINTGDKDNENNVTRGIKSAAFMFSTSWLGIVYDDPFCPIGTAYILDSKAIDLISITDASKVNKTTVPANDPGNENVLSVKDSTDQPYQLNIEDYITIQPSSLVADGAGAQVIINLFMNFVVYNPAHCAVIKF